MPLVVGSALQIEIMQGPMRGERFFIAEGDCVIVGRDAPDGITLPSENLSRRHACFYMRDGLAAIQDMNSTNGTYVNGTRIQRAPLKEGDLIALGSVILLAQLATSVVTSPMTTRRTPVEVPIRQVSLN